MRYIIVILLILSSARAEEQLKSFYRQRAIMMAQHEYEKNLDLMLMDPDSCRIPVLRDDRIRVLKKNIAELNEKGKFSHCRGRRFVGSRKILSNLEKQKIALLDANKIALNNDSGIVTKEKEKEDLIPVSDNLPEPEDNSFTESEDSLKPEGSLPSRIPVLAGYVGLPYSSNPYSDETFKYSRTDNKMTFLRWKNLPPGLTESIGPQMDVAHGAISGIPTRPGNYKLEAEVGFYDNSIPVVVYRGPVPMTIYSRPQYTILNPFQRTRFDQMSFTKDFPYLGVAFSSGKEDVVRSINGVKTGKAYFEVKIEKMGSNFNLGFGIENTPGRVWDSKFFSFFGANGAYREVQDVFGKTIGRTLKNGDVIMVAIDATAKKVWYGVNGIWCAESDGTSSAYKPGMGLKSSRVNNEQFLNSGREFWPEIHGKNSAVVANFGDQPWYYQPPEGFKGILFEMPEYPFPNMWDMNTGTKYAGVSEAFRAKKSESFMTLDFLGQTAMSNQSYVMDEKGDALLSMSPKNSGRWQLEISYFGYAEKGQFGIAPANFNTRSYKKVGSAGTFSVGLSTTNGGSADLYKGRVEVNGVSTFVDKYQEGEKFYNDDTRFTFDCDFDSMQLVIYADGKKIFDTKLPENKSGWVVATTNASSYTTLYSTPDQIRYPVSGAKFWTLDASVCKSCGNTTSTASINVPSCAATKVSHNGVSCELPGTRVGQEASCTMPRSPSECIANDYGSFTCVDSMSNYKSMESCQSDCTKNGETVYRKCTADGWK